MNVEAFTRYFMNKNETVTEEEEQTFSEFREKISPDIRKHLQEAEVDFTRHEYEQLIKNIWKKNLSKARFRKKDRGDIITD